MNQPQAIDMEQAVLSACLIETTAMPLVSTKIRPEMFYEQRHQKVYDAMLHMSTQGTGIDILTVSEELRRRAGKRVI